MKKLLQGLRAALLICVLATGTGVQAADPGDDIHALRSIGIVMKDGEVVRDNWTAN